MEASTSVLAEGGPLLVNIARTTEVRETPCAYYAAITFSGEKRFGLSFQSLVVVCSRVLNTGDLRLCRHLL